MANQKNESALIKKVKDIANVMASAGVGFTDYITQLTYILFLKMDAEKEELGLGSFIPDGYKSVAVAVVYQSPDKTLADADIQPVHKKVIDQLREKLHAQLRDS